MSGFTSLKLYCQLQDHQKNDIDGMSGLKEQGKIGILLYDNILSVHWDIDKSIKSNIILTVKHFYIRVHYVKGGKIDWKITDNWGLRW